VRGRFGSGGSSVARPWTRTYSGLVVEPCFRVWYASATRGLARIRSSLRHTPTELFAAVIVPADRSRSAKLVTGVTTAPLAGVA
jgi:hypothetical protein